MQVNTFDFEQHKTNGVLSPERNHDSDSTPAIDSPILTLENRNH